MAQSINLSFGSQALGAVPVLRAYLVSLSPGQVLVFASTEDKARAWSRRAFGPDMSGMRLATRTEVGMSWMKRYTVK